MYIVIWLEVESVEVWVQKGSICFVIRQQLDSSCVQPLR